MEKGKRLHCAVGKVGDPVLAADGLTFSKRILNGHLELHLTTIPASLPQMCYMSC